MSEDSNTDYSGRLAWFLTGVFIGATVAILYAPKAGKDTRQFLTETGAAAKKPWPKPARTSPTPASDMFERGRKLVDDAAELFDRGRKLVQG